MGYALMVGEKVTSLSSAEPFHKLLNWIAERPEAARGAYEVILDTDPTEDEFPPTGERSAEQLIGELESVLAQSPPETLRFIVELWLREARRSVETGVALEFV